MRGLDALAEACKPQENPAECVASNPTLSEDMVNKIADKVVQKLQSSEQPAASEEGSAGSEEGSAGTEEGGGADD